MFEAIQKMLAILKSLNEDPRIRLLLQAKKCLNQKLTANNEFGCAKSINEIHRREWGVEIGGNYSTIGLFQALKSDRVHFVRVDNPSSGDIIISYTGSGNGKIKNGHCGVIGFDNKIMSNSSINGRFIENYSLDTWKERYEKIGGMPVYFFRKISN